MKKISFKNLITFALIFANVIFFSVLYLVFNNFYLENTKKKFVDENVYSLKVANDFISKEAKSLEKLVKQAVNNDRLVFALIYKKFVSIEFSKKEESNYKMSEINTFGYKKIINDVKKYILGDSGAMEDISKRELELYDEKGMKIADTAMRKIEGTYTKPLAEIARLNRNGVAGSFSGMNYYNNSFLLSCISGVLLGGESKFYGAVVVKEEIDGITLEEIKKVANRELVIVKDKKIVLSTMYKGTDRIVDGSIDVDFSNPKEAHELVINDKKMYFNFQAIYDYENKIIGYIGVGFYKDDVEKIFKESSKKIIVYFIIFTLILTIIIYLILNFLFKPFNAITKGIRKYSEGQYSEKIKTKALGELNLLVKDINELSNAVEKREQELKEKNEKLLELDKLKDEFLANTSHELRTPLNGIIGIAESLIDGVAGKLSSSANYNLSMIVTSGKRLFNLVNDILDFSKTKKKEMKINQKPLNLQEMTDISLMVSKSLLGNKNIELENNIEKDVPAIFADENRIQQIFINLIGNAIKFTNEGKISISAKQQKEMMEVCVQDTGIGIAEDKFEKIFESFEQVDASSSRKYGGTGLGLSITRKLIEMHGGTIRVESKVGVGSKFIFTMPTTDKKPEKVETVRQLELPKAENIANLNQEIIVNPNGYKILVVDDEPINLAVITNYLSMEGYELRTANSGQEALDILAEEKFDMVLLDIMMPIMSGYTVLKEIRKNIHGSRLPVIFLTAMNQAEDLVEGFDAGANDYLTKPILKGELLSRMKFHINLTKLATSYGRFVPVEFLKSLGKENILDVKLGDSVEKEMFIMYIGIRSFTTHTEKMSAEESFTFIKNYLERVAPIVRKNNGFIDKFIGDGIMAIFPKKIEDVIKCAEEINLEVAEYNLELRKADNNSIRIGIGIHKGKMILGTLGEPERIEATVISDAVNIVFGIEDMTKKYGSTVLLSDTARVLVRDSKNFRFLGKMKLKGRTEETNLFEYFGVEREECIKIKAETKHEFEKALVMMHEGQSMHAKKIFKSIADRNKSDEAAKVYSENL